MRAVVTGATGFLGKWLVEELISQGNEVVAFVRDMSKIPFKWKESSSIKCVKFSLHDMESMQLEGACLEQADIFFHLAWAGTSGMDRADVKLQLANVQASCNAVSLAKKMGCKRFIHAGSIMEYETVKSFSADGFAPGMGNIYSIAKTTSDYMARTLAVKEGLEYINVIISNVYGVAECSARFINVTLKKMLQGERIPLTEGIQKYDFIYVTDAVKVVLLVAEKGNSLENYYIGNSKQECLKDFVVSMHKVVESSSKLAFGEVKMGTIMLTYDEFDTYKLERELGFKPEVSFEEGIKLLSEWLKAEESNEQ